MSVLLTTAEAARLLSLPKRLVDPSEFAWGVNLPPASPKKKKIQRVQNPLRLRARLISTAEREHFQIIGHANTRFGFTLRWRDFDIARIDCGAHRHQKDDGSEEFFPVGTPHIHVYQLGRALDVAAISSEFDCTDANAALIFFARYCNVQGLTGLQLPLRLQK